MKIVRKRINRAFVPQFWHYDAGEGAFSPSTSYRRIWGISLLMLLLVSLVPPGALTVIDMHLTSEALLGEQVHKLDRALVHGKKAAHDVLKPRMETLRFIARNGTPHHLSQAETLEHIRTGLDHPGAEIISVGVANGEGTVLALDGAPPPDTAAWGRWLKTVSRKDVATSGIWSGKDGTPMLTLAATIGINRTHDKTLFATMPFSPILETIKEVDIPRQGDIFLAEGEGRLRTPLENFDEEQEEHLFPTELEDGVQWMIQNPDGEDFRVGIAALEGTPFFVGVVIPEKGGLRAWLELRLELAWFFLSCVAAILLVVYIISTYMINRAYESDRKREEAMIAVESTNRLASIGRLAAGVAHEINNPLAVINENVGLVKDLFTYRDEYHADDKVMRLLDTVLKAVDRCGRITRQLLGFARHVEVEVEPVDIRDVAEDVFTFLQKEAEYRSITVEFEIDQALPSIVTDRGKFQQVLLNLMNNALQAMEKGGSLLVQAHVCEMGMVNIHVRDTGHGIPREDLDRVFEPFYSTKKSTGGTGLGLAITYGLIRELGGEIVVQSELNVGTTFIVTLPMKCPGARNEDITR